MTALAKLDNLHFHLAFTYTYPFRYVPPTSFLNTPYKCICKSESLVPSWAPTTGRSHPLETLHSFAWIHTTSLYHYHYRHCHHHHHHYRQHKIHTTMSLHLDDIHKAIQNLGYKLQDSSFGPLIRFDCYLESAAPDSSKSANRPSPKRVGYIFAYQLPAGRVHVESFRFDTPRDRIRNKRLGSLFELDPSKLMVLAALCRAEKRGGRKIYGLAIDDFKEQHKRLVAYMKRVGYAKPIRYVGDGWASLPDKLVWGGNGLIMVGDIQEMIGKWERFVVQLANNDVYNNSKPRLL